MHDEVDKFLENQTEDKNDPFKPESADPFEKKEEVKPEVKEEVKDEKPLPFHKDPKVQRYIEKELDKRIESLKTAQPSITPQEIKDEADEILTRIIGNDTPEKQSAIKDFKKYLSGLEEKGAQKAIAQLQRQQDEERKAEREASEKLDQGFESIEETYGVDITSNTPASKKTRSEFIEFIKRVSPKDENGEASQLPDLTETFGLFQEMSKSKAPSNSKAKEISSRSMARSNDASNAPVNSDKSWKSVDRIFSKLN